MMADTIALQKAGFAKEFDMKLFRGILSGADETRIGQLKDAGVHVYTGVQSPGDVLISPPGFVVSLTAFDDTVPMGVKCGFITRVTPVVEMYKAWFAVNGSDDNLKAIVDAHASKQ